MDPVLQSGVQSFPTPVVSDQIITEYLPTETGQYQILPYGTLWDSVEHGANPKSYPNFQLVYQAPSLGNNGWFLMRIWVNNRIDQDSYNAAEISFEQSDPAFPQITRVYVYPRDSYNTDPVGPNGPLAPLTPDSQYPQALLVQEQMLNQASPEQIQSKYIKVVRVFQTVPGPVVLSQDFDPELNTMVETSRQLLLSTDQLDPSTIPLLLQVQESPQTKYTKMRAMSYLLELPDPYTETANGTYNFPTLVFDIPLALYQLTTDPDRSEVYWEFDKQDGPQVPAILSTTTTFSTGEPADEALFTLPIQTLFYRGVSFQITIANVLNDDITVSATFTGDARYGDLAESKNFPATTISASDYRDNYRGTTQIIGCDIKRYRGNVWVKRVTTVLLV
jgi:hypothetical protein